MVTSSRTLRSPIMLMDFNLDFEYTKRNTILHVDALSRLSFSFISESEKYEERSGDIFSHQVETDIL